MLHTSISLASIKTSTKIFLFLSGFEDPHQGNLVLKFTITSPTRVATCVRSWFSCYWYSRSFGKKQQLYSVISPILAHPSLVLHYSFQCFGGRQIDILSVCLVLYEIDRFQNIWFRQKSYINFFRRCGSLQQILCCLRGMQVGLQGVLISFYTLVDLGCSFLGRRIFCYLSGLATVAIQYLIITNYFLFLNLNFNING